MIFAVAAAAALMSQAGEARPARPDRASLNEYFSADDYPRNSLNRRAEGTTAFRLEIGADGTLTGCSITASSGDAALDAATCSVLLGRARYQPAWDASGRAIPGTDEGRVTWRLPALPPFRPTRVVSRLRTDGVGGVTCSVTTDGTARTEVPPEQCGSFRGRRLDESLRQARSPIEVTFVSMTGPASAGIESAGADEAGLGTLQFDMVAEFDIAPDGRVVRCRSIRRNIPDGSDFRNVLDLCEPVPNAQPMFEASADRSPRVARHRLAAYLKGERLILGVPAGRPRANLSSYFSADDYPEEALRVGAEGTVHFRLVINSDGRVSGCSLVRSSGNAALDARTCEVLIGRARYQPARNTAGQAIAGTDQGRVTWRLPEPEPEPAAAMPAPVRFEMVLGSGADGRRICRVVVNGVEDGADFLCGLFRRAEGNDWMADIPPDVLIVANLTVALDGEPVPPRSVVDRGELIFDSRARLSVDQTGRISDCQALGAQLRGPMAGMNDANAQAGMPQLCDMPGIAGETMFPAAPDGPPSRAGTVHMEVYLRTGITRTTT